MGSGCGNGSRRSEPGSIESGSTSTAPEPAPRVGLPYPQKFSFIPTFSARPPIGARSRTVWIEAAL